MQKKAAKVAAPREQATDLESVLNLYTKISWRINGTERPGARINTNRLIPAITRWSHTSWQRTCRDKGCSRVESVQKIILIGEVLTIER